MRLLNAKTYGLEEYYEGSIPPFAILSHRWGAEEVSFADVVAENFRHKRAFEKVHFTCKQAIQDGLGFVWIDTLCINKDSSAELSEAINSMFRWYQSAAICYAFLSDVQMPVEPLHEQPYYTDSQWFRRGWTLQELIAPIKMEFFGSGWKSIGSRHGLRGEIAKRTKVDIELLQDNRIPLEETLPALAIAKRMSWAACRETSRIEDRAYSLMGLFGVNMPLLYGEGPKAFMRLQEEIIKTTTDLSILAWERTQSKSASRDLLLAVSPDDFESCDTISLAPTNMFWRSESTTLSIVNSGLRIENPYVLIPRDGAVHVSLECRRESEAIAVLALRICNNGVDVENRPKEFQRTYYQVEDRMPLVSVNFLKPARLKQWSTLTVGRVSNALSTGRNYKASPTSYIWVELPNGRRSTPDWLILDHWPKERWDLNDLTFSLKREPSLETKPERVKEQWIYGALALISELGKASIFFVHRPHGAHSGSVGNTYTTLAPFDPATFPRDQKPIAAEYFGEKRTHSLPLTKKHLLRVDYKQRIRYGFRIDNLQLSIDTRSK